MESQNDRLFQWEKHSWSPLSWSFKTIKIILIGYIKSAPLLPQSLMLGMSCSYYETRTFMYIPSGKKDGNVKSPFLHSIPIQSWGFPWFSIAMSAGGYPIHSHPELPLAVPKPGITGPFFPRLTILGSGRLWRLHRDHTKLGSTSGFVWK